MNNYFLQAGDELFPKDDKGELIYTDDDYVDTWKAMEECVEKGQVRSIGLSNFNIKQTERVLSIAKIKPANMQVSYVTFLPLTAYSQNKVYYNWISIYAMTVPISQMQMYHYVYIELICISLWVEFSKKCTQILVKIWMGEPVRFTE